MTIQNDRPSAIPTSAAKQPSRLLVIAVTGFACIGLAGWAVSAIYRFSDPQNQDPTPLPRTKLNAPFIKSKNNIVDRMIEMAEISDQDLVYDLGCGDGRILIAAAVQRGCRGIGFDIDPDRIAEAEKNADEQSVAWLVSFEQQDVFQVDLTEADVVVMYLLPWMLEELVPQFDRCRPGTRLVSNDFAIEGIQSDKSIFAEAEDGETHRVHLYTTPLVKLPPKPKWQPKR